MYIVGIDWAYKR